MDLQEIMQQRCVEMKMPGIPLTGQETLFPQPLQRVAFAIVRRHHAQAGGAAVHLVVLYVVGKSFHFAIKLSSVCISSSSCKSLATILHLWSSKKFLGILFTPKSCTCFNITRLSSVPIT